ncbi:MAG: hypothetical protein ACTSQ6_11605, partial [Candidatus Heimdallarchaeaceae archaeon]
YRNGTFYYCPICKKKNFYKCRHVSNPELVIEADNYYFFETFTDKQIEKAKKLKEREKEKIALKNKILSNPRRYRKYLSYIRSINPKLWDQCYYEFYSEYEYGYPRFTTCDECGRWVCDCCYNLIKGKIICKVCQEEKGLKTDD